MQESGELKRLRNSLVDVADELRRLDLMEHANRQAIAEISEGPVDSADAERKLSDARTNLSLVAARRRKLKAPHSELIRDLEAQFRMEIKAWNATVAKAREAKFEEIVKVNAPFWPNEERRLRRALDRSYEPPPVLLWFARATFSPGHYEDPTKRDLIADVARLIDHCRRWSKTLGLA